MSAHWNDKKAEPPYTREGWQLQLVTGDAVLGPAATGIPMPSDIRCLSPPQVSWLRGDFLPHERALLSGCVRRLKLEQHSPHVSGARGNDGSGWDRRNRGSHRWAVRAAATTHNRSPVGTSPNFSREAEKCDSTWCPLYLNHDWEWRSGPGRRQTTHWRPGAPKASPRPEFLHISGQCGWADRGRRTPGRASSPGGHGGHYGPISSLVWTSLWGEMPHLVRKCTHKEIQMVSSGLGSGRSSKGFLQPGLTYEKCHLALGHVQGVLR